MKTPAGFTFCLILIGAGVGCPLRQNAAFPGGDASAEAEGPPDRRSTGTGGAIGTAGAMGAVPGQGGGGAGASVGSAGYGGASAGTGGGKPVSDAGQTAPQADGPIGTQEVGTACNSGTDCASGACADGVCCTTACSESCFSCKISGLVGHCSPVAAGIAAPATHPACPKMGASTCKQNGLCDGNGGCQLYLSGEVCGTSTCSTATQMSVGASTCDGLGACKPPAAVACAPFKCKGDGSGCATVCAGDTDCQGQPCVAGSCGKVGNGSKCISGSQCISGNCVDGVCCTTSTCPTCQACNIGSAGTCGNKPAAAADSACLTTSCKTGTCDGKGACSVASDGVMCGTNRFCRTGTCGACTPNLACSPANPCKDGVTSCSSGVMVCTETTNRAANTPCGAVASCSGTTKTNAAVCTNGVCGATKETCASGCNAARNDCLRCSGSETACNGMCCAEATPFCSGSACVECLISANCPSGKPVCESRHVCGCAEKSQSNLLVNGGFDSGTQGWQAGSWSSMDAERLLGLGLDHEWASILPAGHRRHDLSCGVDHEGGRRVLDMDVSGYQLTR